MAARTTWGSNTSAAGRITAISFRPSPNRRALNGAQIALVHGMMQAPHGAGQGRSSACHLENTMAAKQLSFPLMRRSALSATSSRDVMLPADRPQLLHALAVRLFAGQKPQRPFRLHPHQFQRREQPRRIAVFQLLTVWFQSMASSFPRFSLCTATVSSGNRRRPDRRRSSSSSGPSHGLPEKGASVLHAPHDAFPVLTCAFCSPPSSETDFVEHGHGGVHVGADPAAYKQTQPRSPQRR